MHRMKLPRALAGLLLAGLLVAACAEPGSDDAGDGAGQGGAITAPTTAPTTVPDERTEPTRPAVEVTVTGTVRAGVEPGCLLLEDQAGGRFLLVGGERAELAPGGHRPGRPRPAQHLPAGRAAGGGLDRAGPVEAPAASGSSGSGIGRPA